MLNNPEDYEWLKNHFISTKHLISDKTYDLYLQSYSKNRFEISAMTNFTRQIVPANYTALQEEVKQMCDRLKKLLDK